MTKNSDPQSTTPNPLVWVDLYSEYLFRFAFIRIRNHQVAEDLVQDTFLSALKSMADFKGQAAEKTWLTAILKNKIIDHLRSAYNRSAEFKDELYCETEEVFTESGRWKGHWIWFRGPEIWPSQPDAYIESKEFWAVLTRCIDELPERYAVIFTLSELEEVESKKLCKELELSESNLWVILHRIRKQLRRCLEIRWLGKSPIMKRRS